MRKKSTPRERMEAAGYVRDSGNGDGCAWVRASDDVTVIWFTMSQGWVVVGPDGKRKVNSEDDGIAVVLGER